MATSRAVVNQIVRLQQAVDRDRTRLDERLGHDPGPDEFREMSATFERAAPLFASLEMAAPQPGGRETPLAYRRRIATLLQPLSPDWSKARLDALPEPTFSTVERLVYADAQAAALDMTRGSARADNELRRVEVETAGIKETKFAGRTSAWMRLFQPPVTCVVGATDPRTGQPLAMGRRWL